MKALRGSNQASLKLVESAETQISRIGRVRRDHESGGLGLLKDDFELAAFPFNVEIVLVAKVQQAFLQIVEEGVGLFLEVVFSKHSGFARAALQWP